jgi:hypothetical protein
MTNFLVVLDALNDPFLNITRCLGLLASLFNTLILIITTTATTSTNTPNTSNHKNSLLLATCLADFTHSLSLISMSIASHICTIQRAVGNANPLTCLLFAVSYIAFNEYLSSVMLTFNLISLAYLNLRAKVHIIESITSGSLILILSFGIYSPVLLMNRVVIHSNVSYTPESSEFGNSDLADWIMDALNVSRVVISLVILPVSAIFSGFFQFKSDFNRQGGEFSSIFVHFYG